jgi:hypothetical protein
MSYGLQGLGDVIGFGRYQQQIDWLIFTGRRAVESILSAGGSVLNDSLALVGGLPWQQGHPGARTLQVGGEKRAN